MDSSAEDRLVRTNKFVDIDQFYDPRHPRVRADPAHEAVCTFLEPPGLQPTHACTATSIAGPIEASSTSTSRRSYTSRRTSRPMGARAVHRSMASCSRPSTSSDQTEPSKFVPRSTLSRRSSRLGGLCWGCCWMCSMRVRSGEPGCDRQRVGRKIKKWRSSSWDSAPAATNSSRKPVRIIFVDTREIHSWALPGIAGGAPASVVVKNRQWSAASVERRCSREGTNER